MCYDKRMTPVVPVLHLTAHVLSMWIAKTGLSYSCKYYIYMCLCQEDNGVKYLIQMISYENLVNPEIKWV